MNPMNTVKENIEFAKGLAQENYDNALKLGELNLRTWEKVVEKQLEVFGIFADVSLKQFDLVKEVKDVNDVKELVSAQTALAKEVSESLVAKARESVELANAVREEYKAFAEANVKAATSKWEAAAKKAA